MASEDRIADATLDGEPMTLTIGEGDMIAGLESRLVDRGSVQAVPRARFLAHMQMESGQVIGFEQSDGGETRGSVIEIRDKHVLVDFGRP